MELFHVNECPNCLSPYDIRDPFCAPLFQLGYGICFPAVCFSCGHILAIGISQDRQRVETGKVTYKWLHDDLCKEITLQELHDKQEEIHFLNGHWG